MKPADELLVHDLRAPIGKLKTALSLMRDASQEELEQDYFPILEAAIQELENRVEQVRTRLT